MNLDNWKERVQDLLAKFSQWEETYPDTSGDVIRTAMVLWPYFQAVMDKNQEALETFSFQAGALKLYGLTDWKSNYVSKIDGEEALIEVIRKVKKSEPALWVEFQKLSEIFDIEKRV